MEKNSTTIIILLMLVLGGIIAAISFGWISFSKLKEDKDKDDKKEDDSKKTDSEPVTTNLRPDEVLCNSPNIRAHRYEVDPGELVSLLEIGRQWTEANKQAAIQLFKHEIDTTARKMGGDVRWERIETDKLLFLVVLGDGVDTAIRKTMFDNEIEFTKTCVEKIKRPPLLSNWFGSNTNSNSNTGSNTNTGKRPKDKLPRRD